MAGAAPLLHFQQPIRKDFTNKTIHFLRSILVFLFLFYEPTVVYCFRYKQYQLILEPNNELFISIFFIRAFFALNPCHNSFIQLQEVQDRLFQ
jgi:hypothetical protein